MGAEQPREFGLEPEGRHNRSPARERREPYWLNSRGNNGYKSAEGLM